MCSPGGLGVMLYEMLAGQRAADAGGRGATRLPGVLTRGRAPADAYA